MARRTTLVSVGCVAFLAGLGLIRLAPDWRVGTTGIIMAGMCLIGCLPKRTIVAVPAVIMAGLLVGLWRGGNLQQALAEYNQYFFTQVTIVGTVNEDPTYGSKGQLDIRLDRVAINGQSLAGTVRVTTFSVQEPKRGDRVMVSGRLYDGFGNYQAAVYYATINVVERNTSWFEYARRSFAAAVRDSLPEPQASLGLGFLLGIRSQLPQQLDDQMRMLGLTHIVVASGYNLTILVRISRRLFARRSKYQATLASAWLIAGFVTVTGFSPSMTRAALVSGLSLTAWYYGRVIHPVTLLCVAAAITGFANPIYVWGDLGWYLSFLAFCGVMLAAPLLTFRLYGGREPPMLAGILLETVCAQICTLPIILFVFGNVAVLELPANVVILPLIPLTMFLTFVAGAVGLVAPVVGAWLALPASLVLGYMVEIVGVFSAIPWAHHTYKIDAASMVAAYLSLLTVGMIVYWRKRFNYLKVPSIVE